LTVSRHGASTVTAESVEIKIGMLLLQQQTATNAHECVGLSYRTLPDQLIHLVVEANVTPLDDREFILLAVRLLKITFSFH
jgi:hypothetical protein